MLLLAALFGLTVLAATVALPMPWEAAEDLDEALPSMEGVESAMPDAGGMEAIDAMAVAGEPGAEAVEHDCAPDGGWVGEAEPSLAAAVGPCSRTADPFEPSTSETTPLIADFDPAIEAIEIAYEGDTPPELQFVEIDGTTEVLADGIVVARMSGVTGLDLSHVSLIAA